MHLNQLYGYLGRKIDLIETKNVFNKDLPLFVTSRIIKNIIKINDKISTLLLYNNLNDQTLLELNSTFDLNLKNSFLNVKTNVAIAAAVTAYARIYILPFKFNPSTVYTDTDSTLTTEIWPENLIGKDLGLIKDELHGKIINEGYFLGINQYG